MLYGFSMSFPLDPITIFGMISTRISQKIFRTRFIVTKNRILEFLMIYVLTKYRSRDEVFIQYCVSLLAYCASFRPVSHRCQTLNVLIFTQALTNSVKTPLTSQIHPLESLLAIFFDDHPQLGVDYAWPPTCVCFPNLHSL